MWNQCADLPVHFQRDGAVDDGEAEHPDPAQQNAPERTRPEVHDEDLQTHWLWVRLRRHSHEPLAQSRRRVIVQPFHDVLLSGECNSWFSAVYRRYWYSCCWFVKKFACVTVTADTCTCTTIESWDKFACRDNKASTVVQYIDTQLLLLFTLRLHL